MTPLNLKNITIKKMLDKNLSPYFLIVNNEKEEEVFFCFPNNLKKGKEILMRNWESLQEAEISYEESWQSGTDRIFRKVVSFWAPAEEEFLA